MMKYIKNIVSFIMAGVFLLATSGIIIYEHHCNCKQETYIALEKEHHCCEGHHNTTSGKNKPCCDDNAQSCPANTNGDCCNTSAIFLKSDQDVDVPVVNKPIRAFSVLLRIIPVENTKVLVDEEEYETYNPPYKLLLHQQYFILTQWQNAPPLA